MRSPVAVHCLSSSHPSHRQQHDDDNHHHHHEPGAFLVPTVLVSMNLALILTPCASFHAT